MAMNVKKSLASLIGFSLLISASTGQANSLQRIIEKAAAETTGAVPPVAAGGGYDAEKAKVINALATKQEVLSCLESTCGPAKINWSYGSISQDRQTLSQEVKAVLPESYTKELVQIYKTEVDAKLLQISRVEKFVQEGRRFELSPELKPFAVAMLSFKDFTEATGGESDYIAFDQETFMYKLNREKYDSIFSKMPAKKRASVKAIIDAFLVPQYEGLSYMDVAKKTLASYLKRKHPKLDYVDALKIEASRALETVKVMQKNLGVIADSLSDESQIDILKRAQSTGLTNKAEESVCLQAIEGMSLFSVIYGPQLSDAIKNYPLDSQQIFTEFKQSSFLSESKADVEIFNLLGEAKSLIDTCRTQLQKSLPLTTSALRIRLFNKTAEEVRRVTKLVATKMVSADKSAWLQAELNKINFVHEDTAEERLGDVLGAIKKMKNSGVNAYNTAVKSSDEVNATIVVMGYLSNKDPFKKNLVDESYLKKACLALPSSVISDATIPQTGNIFVSWYSVNYPDLGAAILAHEMGHIVSYKLRQLPEAANQGFTNTLNCTANRNPFVPQPRAIKAKENTVWSEEDFADHFSTEVMNQLRREGSSLASGKNMGCGLISNSTNSYDIENEIMPALNDSHSSGFLRLLMIGQDFNKQTPECQSVLNKIQSPYQAPRCN